MGIKANTATGEAVRPVDHFIKFFKQLPGLSPRELDERDWRALFALEDRDEFRLKVGEYFPGLDDVQQSRMAQFIYDKYQELLRETGEDSPEAS